MGVRRGACMHGMSECMCVRVDAHIHISPKHKHPSHHSSLGSCFDNVIPASKVNPQDPFWLANPRPDFTGAGDGCGFSIDNYPGVTVLGLNNNFLGNFGYRNYFEGRVWFLDADWQDGADKPQVQIDFLFAILSFVWEPGEF